MNLNITVLPVYFRATHYLCILWWPKQLQDFKSLCSIGRGQGLYHPGDGETAEEVWEERRLVLHHLVLRRREQHWHSHHYQAGQALMLCAQNYLCSGLFLPCHANFSGYMYTSESNCWCHESLLQSVYISRDFFLK